METSALKEFVDARINAMGITYEMLCEQMGISQPEILEQKLLGTSALTLKQARGLAWTLATTVEHICVLIDEG